MVIDHSKGSSNNSYPINLIDRSNFFQFTTDYGVIYRVGFLLSDLLGIENVYEFIIANLNNRKSPNDPKLRQTILGIIYTFFKQPNHAMLYLCETGDEKQSQRSRLFESWFKSSPHQKNFVYLSAHATDEDGIMNYIAVIARTDNPNLLQIETAFNKNVELFQEKPE